MRASMKLLITTLLATFVLPIIAATQANASTGAAQQTLTPMVMTVAAKSSGHVTIPSNYYYNPHTKSHPTLHDYCTKSPDSFPAPGKNADFRGPCARHDMCIQYRQKARSSCDADLLNNMYRECKYTYGFFDPRRYPCLNTARAYWAVVRVKTVFS